MQQQAIHCAGMAFFPGSRVPVRVSHGHWLDGSPIGYGVVHCDADVAATPVPTMVSFPSGKAG
jgi:hypothetical protein